MSRLSTASKRLQSPSFTHLSLLPDHSKSCVDLHSQEEEPVYGSSEFRDFEVVLSMTPSLLHELQVAMLWVGQRVTAPLLGINKVERVQEFVDALKHSLTKEEIDYISEPYQPHQVMGHS